MAVKSLTPQDVVSSYEAYKQRSRSSRSVATSNWPTVLAHDCEAYAYYNRTVPTKDRRQIGEALDVKDVVEQEQNVLDRRPVDGH